MQPTLISDFEHDMDWLRNLEHHLDALHNLSFPLRLWIRDKGVITRELPILSLRRVAKKLKLQLQWSWCHRHEAQAHEWLHIPDDDQLRETSIADSGRRILSCHAIPHAELLLKAYPADHVLLSPWAPSLSKYNHNQPLNRDQAIGLAQRYPDRIHLTSGLTPSDFKSLNSYPFASLCLLGALRGNMASCLEQLQAQYRAVSSPR